METRALGMLFVMLRHFLLIKGKENINAVKLNVTARNKSNALINNEVMKVSMMEVVVENTGSSANQGKLQWYGF